MQEESRIIKVSSVSDYVSEINKDVKCVINFTAYWCDPCVLINPFYEKLSNLYGGCGINFLEIDIENSEGVITLEDVRTIPTFLFYNRGCKTPIVMKGVDKTQLRSLVELFVSVP